MKYFKLEDNYYNLSVLKELSLIVGSYDMEKGVTGWGIWFLDKQFDDFFSISIDCIRLEKFKHNFKVFLACTDEPFFDFDFWASKRNAFYPEDEDE
jgi:hypothetical protein